ncbi:hypothetical protein DI270_024910 [Microbispora triticiradicis]|uniref:Uncharacterized protein n=1 Tax=Microbispora triticiradicis TaxID=2200763 RepID=A0ABX9LEL6_9ACTN|nr:MULTISPECIES: hypothetical protein [Microbispora]RGA02345.1 hypothetical protein DI270_024910 [Microbispora triticiradicis]GLW21070.1 hypothetical protein Mame01_11130 [Microbispora amethystogenes]
MSIEWVNRAVDGLRAWGRERNVEVDVDEVRLLCDYASDYLEVNELGDFRPGTFEELLLEIYPRKVIAPPESAPETVAAARTLVEFLLDTGEIGGKTAARMRATIDEIEPEMPRALADTSKFGMAKSLFSAIGPDSLELDAAGGRAEGETDGPDCDCPGCAPLPPVRLAPAEEVARAAREVPLLVDAHRVVTWLAEGRRTLTLRRSLRAADARAIRDGLGVRRPEAAWRLALELGLAHAGPPAVEAAEGFRDLAERGDEEVLDLWTGALELLIEGLVPLTGERVVDDGMAQIHDLLYRLQSPVPVDALADYLRELADGRPVGRLDEALTGLAYAGTVQRTEDGLALTTHALWGLREVYAGMGMDAPLAPDLAEGDASGLIAGLIGDGPADEAAERDIAEWLSRRTPEQAAAELLAAVAGAPAEVRGVAVTIVDRLGREAAPVVRSYLDDTELRPHAIHWLSSRGLEAPALTPEEVLWMSVDMLALALPAAEADPEGFAENIAASGPPPHLIEDMWRVEHPDVVEVLELLGNTLRDQAAAKAARKAAFKARSRGIR